MSAVADAIFQQTGEWRNGPTFPIVSTPILYTHWECPEWTTHEAHDWGGGQCSGYGYPIDSGYENKPWRYKFEEPMAYEAHRMSEDTDRIETPSVRDLAAVIYPGINGVHVTRAYSLAVTMWNNYTSEKAKGEFPLETLKSMCGSSSPDFLSAYVINHKGYLDGRHPWWDDTVRYLHERTLCSRCVSEMKEFPGTQSALMKIAI